jgi:beta-glucosidase
MVINKINTKVLDLIAQMTVDEKLQCLHGQIWDKYRGNQAGFVKGIERLNIPDCFIADGESGINTSWDATAYPAKVGLAASFDRQTARLYGERLGKEGRAMGINLLLTPRVNIVRDYIEGTGKNNGGNYQTYGEDPILNGEMGAEEALGIQTDNNCIANAKQMLGSSNGSAQGSGNVEIDSQTMHEMYIKPFEPVVKCGVGSVMTNYNQVNGVWSCDLAEVQEEIVRKQWGFEGPVIDDWLCLYDPNSIRHGVTLEMPGNDFYNCGNAYSIYGEQLLKAVEDRNQSVTMGDIDNAVYRYLDMLDRFGMLDAQRIPGPIDEKTKDEGIAAARFIAGKTAVLLKNDNILPLDPKKEKIVIIGPGGNRQVMPTFKESSYGFEDRKTGVYQVLLKEFGANISFAMGNDLDGVIVPSKNLRPEKGSVEHGLKRFQGPFTYNILGDGLLTDIPQSPEFTIDREINFIGERALPPIIPELYFSRGNPQYYMWTGLICPEETGEYRIAIQAYMPGVKEFEKKHINVYEMYIATTGNLYIGDKYEDKYSRVGIGSRMFMNGGAVPNSEVVTCMDGFNNAGGTVYLEAGKEYGIFFNQCSVYREAIQIRLAWTTPSMTRKYIDEAAAAAKKADKAVVFAWHKTTNTLSLQYSQNELIEKVAAANPQTLVVLNNGDPVSMPWLDKVKAVLEMWMPGQEGSLATVDVLTGKVDPAGRLSVSFPKKIEDTSVWDPKHPERYAEPGRIDKNDAVHPNTAVFSEGILNGYRWFDTQNIEPLFPFGFGLSYTTFSYEKISAQGKDEFEVHVIIRNTGSCYGEEVVQCYLGKPKYVPEGVQASEKALADFRRIGLEKGETGEVILKVPKSSLCYFDKVSSSWKIFTGERKILIGASSRDIRLEQEITVR